MLYSDTIASRFRNATLLICHRPATNGHHPPQVEMHSLPPTHMRHPFTAPAPTLESEVCAPSILLHEREPNQSNASPRLHQIKPRRQRRSSPKSPHQEPLVPNTNTKQKSAPTPTAPTMLHQPQPQIRTQHEQPWQQSTTNAVTNQNVPRTTSAPSESVLPPYSLGLPSERSRATTEAALQALPQASRRRPRAANQDQQENCPAAADSSRHHQKTPRLAVPRSTRNYQRKEP